MWLTGKGVLDHGLHDLLHHMAQAIRPRRGLAKDADILRLTAKSGNETRALLAMPFGGVPLN